MTNNALVVISNRLPVTVKKQDGKLVFSGATGGLASAMSSVEAEEIVWVGWPGIESDDLTIAEKSKITSVLAEQRCYPVFLSNKQIQEFYNGYANDTLWPLFHYFQDHTRFDRSYWSTYKEVNELFANVIEGLVRTDNVTFWVHDYHLMLLPNLLRLRYKRSAIGFFLHIPFPSYELFRLLPERKELLQGLVGADLIGFHIFDYARHFLDSCLRLLDLENDHGIVQIGERFVKVDAIPIGIDYDKFIEARSRVDVRESYEAISDAYRGEKIILSIDRLDYTKAIEPRLEAYQALLEEHPEYLGRVRLIMIAVPSRVEVLTYRELRDSLELAVTRINGMFGTTEWAPISYQFQNLPFHEVVALYARADVMLVTPMRDGMNLVAKEYVASKVNQPGVLVLSEMAGAVEELPESIAVNQNDVVSMKDAMAKALKMSKAEQLRRLSRMQQRLRDNTVQYWNQLFITELWNTKQKYGLRKDRILDANKRTQLVDEFRTAKNRLIIFDYDGTLQGFKPTPDPIAARPSAQMMKSLIAISEQPNTKLYIISGRRYQDLDSWFSQTKFNLVAEHGAWKRGSKGWEHGTFDFDDVKDNVRKLMSKYVSRTVGSFIEEKDYAIVWHYRNVSPELGYVRSSNLRQELEELLLETDVNVYPGNKVIEVKPKELSKGTTVRNIIENEEFDFILCAGDDYTDEDMFEALPTANTIKVGNGLTKAKIVALSVDSIAKLVHGLAK